MASGASSSRSGWARKLLVGKSGILTFVFTILGAVGFYLGSSIQLKLSLTDLLPDNHPAVVKFNELTKIVGGVGFLAIVLHAEDGKSHLAAAPTIEAEMLKNPLVRSIAYHREQRYFTDRMLYYFTLDQLKELETNLEASIKTSKRKVFDLGLWDDEPKKEEKPVFDKKMTELAKKSADVSEYLTSADNKTLLIMVKPNFDSMELGKTKDLVASTDELLKRVLPAGVTYQYAERYYNKIVETKMIETDIYVLGSASILLIMLTLLFYIRSVRGLVLIFAPVFIGLGITIGLTQLLIGHINIITGFLMGIVSGLGVDYGIHLLLRLRLENKEPSSADPDPVWRTLASSGHSVFVGALAASFAFYLLCFSKFRAFSEFGFICGTGIAAVFIALLCTFSFLARWMKADRITEKEAAAKPSKMQFPVLPVPKGLVAGVAVTLALIGVGFLVQFEYDFDKMMR